MARARPARVDHFTRPLVNSELRRVEQFESRREGPLALGLGTVAVQTQVAGYQKVRQVTEQVLGTEPLDLPVESYETVGLWLLPDADSLAAAEDDGGEAAGALHAIEHVLIDRKDDGG